MITIHEVKKTAGKALLAGGVALVGLGLASGTAQAFNPQPDPPGKPGVAQGFDPQPDPPGRTRSIIAVNPQPERPRTQTSVQGSGLS
jgi:hypothetical protein